MPESPIVVKIGGALVGDRELLAPLWRALGKRHPASSALVVHGGGPQATSLARRLGHEPRIVHGRRVTTDLDLDVVKWTLRGSVNAELVAQAQAAGLPAVGLAGVDGSTVVVKRRPPVEIDGTMVDFGHVGDVQRVDPHLLRTLLEAGFVPVVCPLAGDEAGNLFNVNADTVACAIAAAVGAERFYLVTESGGVRRDAEDPTSLLPECSRSLFDSGIAEGWIAGGMRVKLKVAYDALEAGIPDVHVLAPADLEAGAGGTRIVP